MFALVRIEPRSIVAAHRTRPPGHELIITGERESSSTPLSPGKWACSTGSGARCETSLPDPSALDAGVGWNLPATSEAHLRWTAGRWAS